MDKITHCINHNRFIPVDTEELTALELIGKTVEKSNELVDKSNNHEDRITENEKKKVSYEDMKEKYLMEEINDTMNFNGTWQGITKPTLTEEGMRGQVEKNTSDIIDIKANIDKIRERKFKPKLWQSVYIRNLLSDGTTSRDKELIRQDFEQLADFGVDGVWLPIHVGYNSATNDLYYQTNLDTLDYVFNTLVPQYKIPVVGVKFHQDWVISNIFLMGEDKFKRRIKDMFNEVADRYTGKFEYFGVFNEWRHFYKKDGFSFNGTTYNYVPFVIECIQMMKNKNLKCSVSIAGCSPKGWSSWNECDKSIIEYSNVILMNGYPPVGNKNIYDLNDTINAWNVYGAKDVIEEIKYNYGDTKKLVITESGVADSFRNYFAPSNTSLSDPNIPEANGKAVSLYLNGMFESDFKNSEMLDGVVWWFTVLRGGVNSKELINKFIHGGKR